MGYNWPMKDLFNAIAATSRQNTYRRPDSSSVIYPEKHAIDIDTLLAKQSIEYPAGTYMMNMITNHDLNSWEGTEFERLGNLTRAMAVLTYTLPGMPLIYTDRKPDSTARWSSSKRICRRHGRLATTTSNSTRNSII